MAAFSPKRVPATPRVARKSEWLRSALAHHHCPDPGAENEIIVLATGIDQYLQEVFHHLAFPNRDDKVSAEDFSTLCSVLGFNGRAGFAVKGSESREKAGEDEEIKDVCTELPTQLSFKDFHSRLCGFFRLRSARKGSGDRLGRLPVTEETELVERQVRLRWPRVRRKKYVSFDLRDQKGSGNGATSGPAEDSDPEEVSALRELVEDLRSALQGSDARCLALEVALRRERSRMGPSVSAAASSSASSITLIKGKLVPTHRIKGQLTSAGGAGARRWVRRCDISDPLLRELKLIRSGRDGQLEEAVKFNERLEEELRWAYREVHKLQGIESALRMENTQIRRRAEEAREALSLGLQRVRMIQEQAQSVPQLRFRITQLETELKQFRSRCVCIYGPPNQDLYSGEGETITKSDSECLQRAVEGRAASDEEEEDRGSNGKRRCCPMEVKNINRLHDCGKVCHNQGVCHLPSQNRLHEKLINSSKDSQGGCRQKQESPRDTTGLDKETRPDEKEDKMRLEEQEISLWEEKLREALKLLLHLRKKHMSCRELGNILMDTLDVCNTSEERPCQVLQVADALCKRLSSSDLLGERGDDIGGGRAENFRVPSSGHQASSVGALLISC